MKTVGSPAYVEFSYRGVPMRLRVKSWPGIVRHWYAAWVKRIPRG